jgi:hypothetical protein
MILYLAFEHLLLSIEGPGDTEAVPTTAQSYISLPLSSDALAVDFQGSCLKKSFEGSK